MYDPLFHVVLHQPRIPHNTGSVGRTCVAVGAKLWLVRPLGFHIDDYYLRRSGLDYWPKLLWEIVDDWPQAETRLGAARTWLFTKNGRHAYTDIAFERGDGLVFGDEARGLPEKLLAERSDQTVRIPIRDDVRSLNLSNAVAIVLYEGLRQLNARGAELP